LLGFGGCSPWHCVASVRPPDLGAVSLAEVFGLFSIALGTWSLVVAASGHHTDSQIEGALTGSGRLTLPITTDAPGRGGRRRAVRARPLVLTTQSHT